MRQRDFDLIVAIDSKRGIGKDNDLPWDLPGDMAHFVSQTKTAPKGRRNAVIMGRNNWESIPLRFRPLKDRHNVVMTSQANYPLNNGLVAPTDQSVVRAGSFDEALTGLPGDIDRVYVIGGGNVFAQAIELEACRRLYLTRIDRDYDCDVFFPAFEHRFERVGIFATVSASAAASSSEQKDGGASYQIELWER